MLLDVLGVQEGLAQQELASEVEALAQLRERQIELVAEMKAVQRQRDQNVTSVRRPEHIYDRRLELLQSRQNELQPVLARAAFGREIKRGDMETVVRKKLAVERLLQKSEKKRAVCISQELAYRLYLRAEETG